VTTEPEILGELMPDTREAVLSLLDWSDDRNLDVQLIDGVRSCEEQMALYAQGRTEPGRVVTSVPGCRSWHVHGRAVGVYAGSWEPVDYYAIGEAWEAMGGRWGGRFGDYGHLEWHPGVSLDELCPDAGGVCPARRSGMVGASVAVVVSGAVVALWMFLRRP